MLSSQNFNLSKSTVLYYYGMGAYFTHPHVVGIKDAYLRNKDLYNFLVVDILDLRYHTFSVKFTVERNRMKSEL
jgi:hypothetical protein